MANFNTQMGVAIIYRAMKILFDSQIKVGLPPRMQSTKWSDSTCLLSVHGNTLIYFKKWMKLKILIGSEILLPKWRLSYSHAKS